MNAYDWNLSGLVLGLDSSYMHPARSHSSKFLQSDEFQFPSAFHPSPSVTRHRHLCFPRSYQNSDQLIDFGSTMASQPTIGFWLTYGFAVSYKFCWGGRHCSDCGSLFSPPHSSKLSPVSGTQCTNYPSLSACSLR
jgi:hypothetical protein